MYIYGVAPVCGTLSDVSTSHKCTNTYNGIPSRLPILHLIPSPTMLLVLLPISSALILLLLLLYHLTPLLALVSDLPIPLHRLSTIIPHPKRARNLPREFFNLPPRPGSSNADSTLTLREIGSRLGVRGKLMLLLICEGAISLIAGWIVLKLGVQDSDNGVWAAVAVSIMLLPGTAAWLAIFVMLSRPAHYDRQAKSRLSNVRRAVFGAGGISHLTLYPRILPLSSATTCVGVILAGVLGDSARYIILAWTATYIAILVGCGAMGLWQIARTPRKGMIRLRGESRMSMYEEKSDFILAEKGEEGLRVGATCLDGNANGLEQLKRSDSWVSSPCMWRFHLFHIHQLTVSNSTPPDSYFFFRVFTRDRRRVLV